jgi:histidyl-tRNA synthetase
VGSKDIPACGLAFYLDELAGQVKPYSLRKAEKTVLVRSRKHTPAAIKAAFTLAGALRRAGLIAEFDFRGSQLTARWIVTVSDTEEGFLLKDNAKGASRKIGDIASVISVIGGFGKRAR